MQQHTLTKHIRNVQIYAYIAYAQKHKHTNHHKHNKYKHKHKHNKYKHKHKHKHAHAHAQCHTRTLLGGPTMEPSSLSGAVSCASNRFTSSGTCTFTTVQSAICSRPTHVKYVSKVNMEISHALNHIKFARITLKTYKNTPTHAQTQIHAQTCKYTLTHANTHTCKYKYENTNTCKQIHLPSIQAMGAPESTMAIFPSKKHFIRSTLLTFSSVCSF